MGWASRYIAELHQGRRVQFRPRGNSMQPRIKSGQLVTVAPVVDFRTLQVDDVVLCKVSGHEFLHLIKAHNADFSQFLIGNNRGGTNGWTSARNVYGRLESVAD